MLPCLRCRDPQRLGGDLDGFAGNGRSLVRRLRRIAKNQFDRGKRKVQLFSDDLRKRRADTGPEIDMAAKGDDAALGGDADIYVEGVFRGRVTSHFAVALRNDSKDS